METSLALLQAAALFISQVTLSFTFSNELKKSLMNRRRCRELAIIAVFPSTIVLFRFPLRFLRIVIALEKTATQQEGARRSEDGTDQRIGIYLFSLNII